MEIKIIKEGKDSIEVEFEGYDEGLVALIAERLNAKKEVEMAASKVEHPLISHPTLFLKVSKGDAKKILKETLKEIEKEVKKFSKEFSAL